MGLKMLVVSTRSSGPELSPASLEETAMVEVGTQSRRQRERERGTHSI